MVYKCTSITHQHLAAFECHLKAWHDGYIHYHHWNCKTLLLDEQFVTIDECFYKVPGVAKLPSGVPRNVIIEHDTKISFDKHLATVDELVFENEQVRRDAENVLRCPTVDDGRQGGQQCDKQAASPHARHSLLFIARHAPRGYLIQDISELWLPKKRKAPDALDGVIERQSPYLRRDVNARTSIPPPVVAAGRGDVTVANLSGSVTPLRTPTRPTGSTSMSKLATRNSTPAPLRKSSLGSDRQLPSQLSREQVLTPGARDTVSGTMKTPLRAHTNTTGVALQPNPPRTSTDPLAPPSTTTPFKPPSFLSRPTGSSTPTTALPRRMLGTTRSSSPAVQKSLQANWAKVSEASKQAGSPFSASASTAHRQREGRGAPTETEEEKLQRKRSVLAQLNQEKELVIVPVDQQRKDGERGDTSSWMFD